jgi:cytochrome c peroxidase
LVLILTALLAAQTGVPAVPTGLQASDGAYANRTGLSWDHVRDALLYEVLRSTTSSPAQAVTVDTVASIIFYDRTGVPGQTYTYWVRALGGNGSSGLSVPDQGMRAVGLEDFSNRLLAPLEPPPIPAGNPETGAKIYLGKALFWEEQLSATRTVACGTCHRPRFGSSDPRSANTPDLAAHPGADGVFGNADDVVGSPGVPLSSVDGTYGWSESFGIRQQVTRRKAQPVFETGYPESLFWDGRADGSLIDPVSEEVVMASGAALENQALHPLVDPTEMSAEGRTWPSIFARIAAAKPLGLAPAVPAALAAWIGGRGYLELFAEAFGTPEITAPRIAMAIGAYERTLYSDRAPFHQWIAQIRTMGPAESRGHKEFIDGNCRLCHQGGLTGDHRFRNIALRPEGGDEGRFEVSGDPADLVAFKTPSLLNVAFSGPFMHNGRFATLEDVVEFYNRGGDFPASNVQGLIQPLGMSTGNKADLIAFMTNELTDPRVQAEAGPLFDRPMLYTESARIPVLIGTATPGTGNRRPQIMAIEPPFAGNPNFTVGLHDARPGAQALLVIDDQAPGSPLSQAMANAREVVEVQVAPQGYASAVVALPNEVGLTLFGRWYVDDPNAAGGTALTQTFRLQLFGVASQVEAGATASVSAASFTQGLVAPESLVSTFGEGLAAFEAYASLPLPTVLGGASVVVRDSTGAEHLARLLYAGPEQINYEVPEGVAAGEAKLIVLRGGIAVAQGTLQIAEAAPSLFAANSNGTGPAAAFAIHVTPGGEQRSEPVAVYDAGAGQFVLNPIDFGPEGDEVVLTLYGTGIRSGDVVEVTFGGAPAEVTFSGPHGSFVGLDQINVRVPRSLAGRGEVAVRVKVNGVAANVVRVNFE